jgi:hypothetical protein
MVNVGGIVSVGGSSGGSGGSTSGITSINGQTGPAIVIVGVNGITVTAGGNQILIDGAGASGTTSGASKFAASFSSISSGLFTHNLGTLDVIVQVYDNGGPRRAIMPDDIIIENTNEISIIFNSPQSGRVVII